MRCKQVQTRDFCPYKERTMTDSIIPNGYLKDDETGYLVASNPRGAIPFGVDTKKRFLELMEQEGNLTGTCKLLGISDKSVYDHLKIDEAFKRDYALCIRRMANTLEGTMFKNGQKPQGYMDRITFLRRWFPQEWTPKTNITVTNDTGTIDELFTRLESEGKIIDVNETR